MAKIEYPIIDNLPSYLYLIISDLFKPTYLPNRGISYVDGTLKYNFSQDAICSTPYMTALVNRFSRQIESMVVLNTIYFISNLWEICSLVKTYLIHCQRLVYHLACN